MSDTLQRFLLEGTPVRGEIVRLDATWRAVLERRDYPEHLKTLLGEMVAAGALLSDAPPEQRSVALGSIHEALVPHRTETGIELDAAVWIVLQ